MTHHMEDNNMATRNQQIQQVALIIAEAMSTIDSDAELEAVITMRNQDEGFSFETSAPLGGILRHEGVKLSEAELTSAFMLATSWASEP